MLKAFGIRVPIVILLVLGLALSLGSYVPWRRESRLAAAPVTTTATVISVSLAPRRGNKAREATITYTFTADGRTYTSLWDTLAADIRGLTTGAPLPVTYLANDPALNRPAFAATPQGRLLAGMLMGALCLVIGGILAVGDLRGRPWTPPWWRRTADIAVDPHRPPAGVTLLTATKDHLAIRYRWLTGRQWLYLVAEIAIAGLFLLWWQSAKACPIRTGPAALAPPATLFAATVLCLHVIVLCLNHTLFTVHRDTAITVRHLPVPWWGQTTIPTAGITEVVVKPHRKSVGRGGGIPIGTPYAYRATGWHQIRLLHESGRDALLYHRFAGLTPARWIGHRLAAFLGCPVSSK